MDDAERKPRRRQGCSPWAITGCGCGTAAMLGIALIFMLLLVRVQQERHDPAWSRAHYGACLKHLGQLGRALESYERDHQALPATLNDLPALYLDRSAARACPLQGLGLGETYQYTPDVAKPDDAVITCPNHKQGPLILQRNWKLRVPK